MATLQANMSSEYSTRLTADLIGDPRLYRLMMRVGETALDVFIYSPLADNSLIYERFGLETTGSGFPVASSLEQTVYDNPLLLAEFERRCIIVDSPCQMLLPDCIAADTDTMHDIVCNSFNISADESDNCPVIISAEVNATDSSLAMTVDPALTRFFNRAFINPPVLPSLRSLLMFFNGRRSAGNTVSMYINIEKNRLDAILYGGSTPVVVKRIRFRAVSDAVYHILELRRIARVDTDDDQILVCGDRDTRITLINELRRFVPSVMPVIFPSAIFKLGRRAMEAPFDLAVAPLCE